MKSASQGADVDITPDSIIGCNSAVARVHLDDFGAIFTAVADVAWLTGHWDGHRYEE